MGSVVSEYRGGILPYRKPPIVLPVTRGTTKKRRTMEWWLLGPLGYGVLCTVAFVDRTPDIIACANLRRGKGGCQLCMIPSPTRLGPF